MMQNTGQSNTICDDQKIGIPITYFLHKIPDVYVLTLLDNVSDTCKSTPWLSLCFLRQNCFPNLMSPDIRYNVTLDHKNKAIGIRKWKKLALFRRVSFATSVKTLLRNIVLLAQLSTSKPLSILTTVMKFLQLEGLFHET